MPYPDPKHMKSDLARARGMGSAKSGTHHWWVIKVSAIALIPLTLWFFFSLLNLLSNDVSYQAALAWIQKPYNSLLMVIFLGMNFYHAGVAGQEILIDYIPNHKMQISASLLYRFFCYGLGILSVFAVLYITFRL
jgi:succinate dehydrogenase / fumarate reductase, membrane anchor subunit